MNTSSTSRRWLIAAGAAAALFAATGARASDVHWSVGISAPIYPGAVSTIISNGPAPYYVQPAPIYYAPPPAYYEPPPRVYYAPPMVVRPQPIVVQRWAPPPRAYWDGGHGHGHGHGHWHR